MGYNNGEALLLTRVQALSNFNSTNTSRGDWSILDSGKNDHYAILRPGSFINEPLSLTDYRTIWTTVIEIWQMYNPANTEQANKTNLYGYVADIFPILQYPNLGNAAQVLDSNIVGGEAPQEMWADQGSGLEWFRWSIDVHWEEITNVTYQE